MNSQQAKEFRNRWQAVSAVEAEEQRVASLALRPLSLGQSPLSLSQRIKETRGWQQTNAILRLAMGLGLSLAEEDSEEIEAVRRRWGLLKGAAT